MRDYVPEIRRQGAELVIVGNGSRYFASTFREELGLDCQVVGDAAGPGTVFEASHQGYRAGRSIR